MGNLCTCFAPKPAVKRGRSVKRLPANSSSQTASNRWTRVRSARKDSNDSLIQEQALAAALMFRQQNGAGATTPTPFDRSVSHRYPNGNAGSKKNPLPRSASSRARSLADPLLQPHQLVNQDIKLDDLETKHFVLVHGGGFGAWCWYKTIALLEESGFTVTAVDLTGSGVHSFDTNGIASLSQYVKPLTDFLEKLADEEKVILVGHDFGGACISYAMELFPHKISKAIFLAAAMLVDGQILPRYIKPFETSEVSYYPILSFLLLCYCFETLSFSPTIQDIALASVSMRLIPFAPVLEKLCLSDAKHGTVRRFYIEAPEDNAIPITLQQTMISSSLPEKVFRLKGADHSPFFSKPQALHKILVEISKMNKA
ncbi:unnamed protein product [Linum tenue]|uniref:AB hydrolase-1 domain-containing protein n=1 Tax=Linum tenue TaxID=586396 RepID=A0AAV0HQ04_9ROSI|nr:unnamed protein product [Linum tenue]